jgi:hypothetical protein
MDRRAGSRALRETLSLRAEAITRCAYGAGPSGVVTGAARAEDRSTHSAVSRRRRWALGCDTDDAAGAH